MVWHLKHNGGNDVVGGGEASRYEQLVVVADIGEVGQVVSVAAGAEPEERGVGGGEGVRDDHHHDVPPLGYGHLGTGRVCWESLHQLGGQPRLGGEVEEVSSPPSPPIAGMVQVRGAPW